MTVVKDLRRGWARQIRVEYHPQGLPHPGSVVQPHIEPRIVHADRAGARQYRGTAGPPHLYIGTRSLVRDPCAAAPGLRGTRIQAHRQFQADERATAFEARKETDVEGARFGSEQTDGHCDPCGLQTVDAAARPPSDWDPPPRTPRA